MSDTNSPNRRERPLSPHLQVYKPQLTSVMSIFHRLTGAANTVGLLLFSAWLVSMAVNEKTYMCVVDFLASPFGQILLIGWSFSVFYHLCNGIRHLFWDAGYLFKLRNAYRAGYAVLAVSFLLTAGMWFCIYTYQPGVN